MRLYVHMMACGSICTLLYIFFKRALPWELPLKYRKAFLRINALLYLLPVPWLAAQVKGWLKLFLEKAGMVFPERTLSNITDTTSVWESILVFDADKKLLYITGYRNWLTVIAGGTLIFTVLAAGWLAVYLVTCRWHMRRAKFPGERYVRAGKRKVRIGTSGCADSPFALGIIRPVVLFPKEALDGIPEGEMEDMLSGGRAGSRLACVLRHEVSHVLSRDILGKFITFLAIATEWFNPLTYYLFKENREVSEMLCDMAAVEGRTKKEKAEYMECIIDATQKPRDPRMTGVSLAASKTLTEKRMERIMGMNVKKAWKKGTAAVIMAVCFLISSIPAFAYEDAKKYTVTEESYDIESLESADWLLFTDEEDVKIDSPEFKEGDIVFTGEDGTVYYIDSFEENGGIKERASCQHTYKSGTVQQHNKKSDGSCTVTTYNAERCTKCGDTIMGSRVSTLIYKVCPH